MNILSNTVLIYDLKLSGFLEEKHDNMYYWFEEDNNGEWRGRIQIRNGLLGSKRIIGLLKNTTLECALTEQSYQTLDGVVVNGAPALEYTVSAPLLLMKHVDGNEKSLRLSVTSRVGLALREALVNYRWDAIGKNEASIAAAVNEHAPLWQKELGLGLKLVKLSPDLATAGVRADAVAAALDQGYKDQIELAKATNVALIASIKNQTDLKLAAGHSQIRITEDQAIKENTTNATLAEMDGKRIILEQLRLPDLLAGAVISPEGMAAVAPAIAAALQSAAVAHLAGGGALTSGIPDMLQRSGSRNAATQPPLARAPGPDRIADELTATFARDGAFVEQFASQGQLRYRVRFPDLVTELVYEGNRFECGKYGKAQPTRTVLRGEFPPDALTDPVAAVNVLLEKGRQGESNH
jgi:hypothetical protein